ncbi:hypothetical protein SAMN02746065_102267 [Desulfocicer vacuolatum DSM 3385]|uniref:Fibronectin type-III domain-containing protein n=1 Tax=Desulfocicer vacuolatum DSM 3385 TaxID=1121400 RepID=A0A1W1ZFP8_9BACT|nr:hypothetical protein [Desulfocicer vacuolatum]SMC47320.1 hypothetical protein SAMN02746065_102267 [Desulfocicer vacuolatum DSM 3385]
MLRLSQKIALVTIVFLFMVVGMGCGKKGPPLAPLALTPPPPVHFTSRLTADRVMLQWKIDSEFQKKNKGKDMGVEIYRARRVLSMDACKGCPLPFEKRADLSAGTLKYGEILEKGFRYSYRLRTRLGINIFSEYSEIVAFDFE